MEYRQGFPQLAVWQFLPPKHCSGPSNIRGKSAERCIYDQSKIIFFYLWIKAPFTPQSESLGPSLKSPEGKPCISQSECNRVKVASCYSTVLEINFLAGSNYLLPSVKVGSKTNILGSKMWPYNSPLAICRGSCQIYDQTKSHKVKGIDNAFDHMELC